MEFQKQTPKQTQEKEVSLTPEQKKDIINGIENGTFELKYCNDLVKNDRDLVIAFVKKDNINAMYLPLQFKNDKELWLECIKENALVASHLSPEQKNDKQFILDAVKVNSGIYNFIGKELQSDKQVILESIKQNGNTLRFISPELLKEYGNTPEKFIANLEKEMLEDQVISYYHMNYPETMDKDLQIEIEKSGELTMVSVKGLDDELKQEETLNRFPRETNLTLEASISIDLNEVFNEFEITKEQVKDYYIKYGVLNLVTEYDKTYVYELNTEDLPFSLYEIKEDNESKLYGNVLDEVKVIEDGCNYKTPFKDINELTIGFFHQETFYLEDICDEYGIEEQDIKEISIGEFGIDIQLLDGIETIEGDDYINIESNTQEFDFKYASYILEDGVRVS